MNAFERELLVKRQAVRRKMDEGTTRGRYKGKEKVRGGRARMVPGSDDVKDGSMMDLIDDD
jgi:hypothetical protein